MSAEGILKQSMDKDIRINLFCYNHKIVMSAEGSSLPTEDSEVISGSS